MKIDAANSISRKMLIAILSMSSMVTAVVTAIQFGYSYKQEMGDIEREFSLIGNSYISSLSQSVWDMNDSAVQLQLAGLRNFPNIDYIELHAKGIPTIGSGAKKASAKYSNRSFNLSRSLDGHTDSIGSVEFFVNIDTVYGRLYQQFVILFLTQLVRTTVICALIYTILSRFITRHLETIAEYLNRVNLQEKFGHLQLSRKPSPPNRMDEFDVLVSSIEQMRERLSANQMELQRLADGHLHERDEARRANQAKSIFLANMSHEIRTPMHGVLSFARFGQQKINTASKEQLKTYFDEIHDSGSRLMNLLNDLLDLSKLEAGKVVYTMHEASLLTPAQAVVSELSAFAEEKGLTLKIIGEAQDVLGNFDSEKIMQVLRNLLSNAIKFSEKGTVIELHLSQDAEKIRCQVCNRGVSIPESELESIFDKFVQSSTTNTGAGGTGLGLAICREIISQHSGKIWAESKSNAETKFVFELPRASITQTIVKYAA